MPHMLVIVFLKINPSWKCCAVESMGLYGGLLLAWDLFVFYFKYFTTGASLMVEGKNLGLDFPVRIMNVYGPYSHKQVFWERIRDGSLLNHQSLI